MDMVLHARHFRELLFLGHVVVDEPEPTVQRHGDSHACLGDGVHVGGHQRDVEMKTLGQSGIYLALFWENLCVEGSQRDVVVGEGRSTVGWEEPGGRLVEL